MQLWTLSVSRTRAMFGDRSFAVAGRRAAWKSFADYCATDDKLLTI